MKSPDNMEVSLTGETPVNSRISDIEVLRGVAVLYVVIHHAYHNLIPWVSPQLEVFFHNFGGWAGVDLFFVISGFVIARDLLPRLRGCSEREEFFRTAVAFWVRRFWRLIPSAWLWLVLVLVCCIAFNSSGVFGSLKANFEGSLSAFLQVANLHLATSFGSPTGSGAVFHYWSLSLEEQFYILLPLVVLLSGRWLPHLLAAVILVQVLSTRSGLYEMMLRTDGILLGVLLALFSKQKVYALFEPTFLRTNVLARVSLLAVLFVALATIGARNATIVEHKVSLINFIALALVFIASYDKNYLMADSVVKKVFTWIGTRSYGIYLIHIPAFYLSREIWYRIGNPTTPTFNPAYLDQLLVTAVLLIIVLSEINYRWIEQPFRRKGSDISKRIQQGFVEEDSQCALRHK